MISEIRKVLLSARLHQFAALNACQHSTIRAYGSVERSSAIQLNGHSSPGLRFHACGDRLPGGAPPHASRLHVVNLRSKARQLRRRQRPVGAAHSSRAKKLCTARCTWILLALPFPVTDCLIRLAVKLATGSSARRAARQITLPRVSHQHGSARIFRMAIDLFQAHGFRTKFLDNLAQPVEQ